MKTIQKRWLPLFLLATVTFLFPACESNDPDEDLIGVITIKMKNGDNPYDATSISCNSYSKLFINNANNFKYYSYSVGSPSVGYEGGAGEIIDMGKRKLGKINSLPSTGWTKETAVLEGHGYIFRARWYSGGIGYIDYGDYKYIKLYVTKYITGTSGGIIGAEVQYCEWNPEQ